MNFKYNTVYSKRRTIAVTVSSDNTVTVRCPIGTDSRRIEKFLSDKSEWITGHLQRNALKINANAAVIDGECVLVNGARRKLIIGETNAIIPDAVTVTSVKNLKKLFLDEYSADFLKKFNYFSALTGITPSGVAFRDYKSRWGCCDAKNRITFNYKLLMLPERLQAYVIVHELCHVKRHDHSSAFYALVKNCMPEYKQAVRELKNYDFITRLY